MKKKISNRYLVFVFLLLVFSSTAQNPDFSKFSGLYKCVEVLQFPDYPPASGFPKNNECWIPNKKYENSKPYTWMTIQPFKVEISGQTIKTLSVSEIYQRIGTSEVHYQTVIELEGTIIGNMATLKGSSKKVPILPLPKTNTTDEITMTVDLSTRKLFNRYTGANCQS